MKDATESHERTGSKQGDKTTECPDRGSGGNKNGPDDAFDGHEERKSDPAP